MGKERECSNRVCGMEQASRPLSIMSTAAGCIPDVRDCLCTESTYEISEGKELNHAWHLFLGTPNLILRSLARFAVARFTNFSRALALFV